MVNGERRYVRHTTFTSSEKRDGPIHARFVYDYREYSTPLVWVRPEPRVVGPV